MMAGMAMEREPLTASPALELFDACDGHRDEWWRDEAVQVSSKQTLELEICDGNRIEVVFSDRPDSADVAITTSGKLRRSVYLVKGHDVVHYVLDSSTENGSTEKQISTSTPPAIELRAMAHVIRSARHATSSLSSLDRRSDRE